MRLIPFEAAHFFACAPQEAQASAAQWMTADIAEAAAKHFSLTAIDETGAIVGCAGVAPVDGAMVAWALFSPLIEKHAIGVFRAVKATLDCHADHRVVMHIDPAHAKAASFAERLNFKFEEARADLHPSGATLHVYVREGRNG